MKHIFCTIVRIFREIFGRTATILLVSIYVYLATSNQAKVQTSTQANAQTSTQVNAQVSIQAIARASTQVNAQASTQANVQTATMKLDPVFEKRGTVLYWQHCVACHGPDGDGRGPQAEFFSPRPSDFTTGNFKFRTSDEGAYPTREDLIRAIDHGAPGVMVDGMPSFAAISALDRHALSEKVAVLANLPHFDLPISIPPRPVSASAEQGRSLYTEFGCVGCHGINADGSGELAADLVDARGMHAQPANLAAGAFKGGNTAEDIWTRIYVGIDGTPMPSFGSSLSAAEIWSLVDFVISVRVKGDDR